MHVYAGRLSKPLLITSLLALTPTFAAAQITSYAFVASIVDGAVNVIETRSGTVIGTPITFGGLLASTATTPDGSRVYVTHGAANAVEVIDLATRTVGTPIPVGNNPYGLAILPDGSKAYVTNNLSNTVSVIDLTTNTVMTTITGFMTPIGVAASPDGQRVYVTNNYYLANNVSVIDTATDITIGLPIAVDSHPLGVAVTPDGKHVYVCNSGANTVSVIDVALGAVTATIPVDAGPFGIAASPDGSVVFVASETARLVDIIDVMTNTVVKTVAVGSLPTGVAFTPDTKLAYVANLGGNSVTQIDVASRAVTATIPVGRGPINLSVFTTPEILTTACSGCVPQTIASDADLTALGVGSYVIFNSGVLSLTGDWTTSRTISLLANGGTINTNAFNATLFGGIINSGALTKTGTGSLFVDGASTATIHLQGGTLGGNGTIGTIDATTGAGTINPGDAAGPAILHAAQATLSPGVTFTTRLNGTAVGTGYGQLAVSGTAAATIAAATLNVQVGYTPSDSDSFTIVTNATGTFAGLAEGAVFAVGSTNFHITYHGGAGSDVVLTATVPPVVEPPPPPPPPPPAVAYYLAEGATGGFFSTDILIANPNTSAAPVLIQYFKDDGTTVEQNMTLTATSRTTIHVNQVAGMQSAAFSTSVTSLNRVPLVVERTMWWDATGYGSHGEKASAGPASTWYFAEGSQGFFHTYFLLLNPHTADTIAHVTYLLEGSAPVQHDYTVHASSRLTIDAGTVPELVNRSFGAQIVFDQPGMAERAMYFGTSPMFSGGHDSAGENAPSTTWFLAEGATGSFFDTFLLFANPNDTDVIATVTYLPASGFPLQTMKTIPAHSRMTINIAGEAPELSSTAVSTQVVASLPILVERSQYWPHPASSWYEAHNSFGVTAAGLKWGLAEGRVGGTNHAQTYILVANPGAQTADLTATFLRTDGTTIIKHFTVAPTSRFNISVTGPGSSVPELVDESFGTVIESSQPVTIERSFYTDANKVTWAAGTNVTATRLP